MAFPKHKDPLQHINEIVNYPQYLKRDADPALKIFQTPEGFYLHVTRIEQTPEEAKMSNAVQGFYEAIAKPSVVGTDE
jgi:hypothetical protein